MHIIYRLKGSIPKAVLKEIVAQRNNLFEDKISTLQADQRKLTSEQLDLVREIVEETVEHLLEEELHFASNGPYYLSKPGIADKIINCWKWSQVNQGIVVHAICVMSNHVHVVAGSANEVEIPPGPVLKTNKGYTARICNELLGMTGKAFWEAGYFDRNVRVGQLHTLMLYVLHNPVKAKLVDEWEDWPGTYLNPMYDAIYRNS
ncbi:MAG: transposase [Saprospiraceae bacterium]